MLTKLDIINAMLASTGTAPLTSNDTQHPFFIKASNKLAIINTEIQSKGWWFNRAIRTLNPDVSGHIVLPSNTLSADPVDRSKQYVIRGNKLYDLPNATNFIGAPVKVWFVDLVEIADLPPSAAEYLKAAAVASFYLDEDGNALKVNEYNRAVAAAFVGFKGENLKNADVNWFDGVSYAQQARGAGRRRLPVTDE